MLFRAIWDFLPEPILKLFKYIPIHPFTRMLALGRIYESYGKRILREKRLDVDAEKEVKNKDIMSILSKYRILLFIHHCARVLTAALRVNS